ncbi:hypothetical protein ACE6H2_020259 [Prunus campanulata]
MDMNIIPEEWKSLFPISSVFKPPLLLSNPSLKPILGPLIFNLKPNSTTLLFSSSSSLPPPLPPLPHLSLSRFLLTSPPDSAPLPSSVPFVASFLGPHHPKSDVSSSLLYNRLEFLQCPQINTVVVFFPTGENSDQVGFLQLVLKVNENGGVFASRRWFSYRISRISVNPIPGFSSLRGNGSCVTIGYLLASTMYSVHWFIVKVGDFGPNSDSRVSLVHLGSKIFKTCCVVHACWSPHLLEESVVLLENGDLFLFDLDSRLKTPHTLNANFKFNGTRLKVPWDIDDGSGSSRNYRWLSYEFSWHPRVLIVARSDAVFLVDLRAHECNVSCLMKVEMLHMYASIEKEQFLVLSKAGSDDFHFVLASDTLLVVCDVRKALMPVLQWAHGLDKPSYVDVLRLSELRSQSRDDKFNWAFDSGFCIIGLFWNFEFNIFCYGPSLPAPIGSVALKIAELRKSFYAWELPSDLLLSGHECHCGSCLDYLLYSLVDEEYKFPRRFKYLKLDYLCGYLNGNLDEVLDEKIKIPYNDQGKELFSSEFHETLCKKLHACGFGKFRSSPAVTSVLNDISLPASIHEVVLKRLWSDLPIELLQLAFSNNSEILEVLVDKNRVALEFSVVPDLSQLPPFILRKSSCLRNKWSQKVQPGDALVGPVLPLPVLLALHEYHNGCPNSDEK